MGLVGTIMPAPAPNRSAKGIVAELVAVNVHGDLAFEDGTGDREIAALLRKQQVMALDDRVGLSVAHGVVMRVGLNLLDQSVVARRKIHAGLGQGFAHVNAHRDVDALLQKRLRGIDARLNEDLLARRAVAPDEFVAPPPGVTVSVIGVLLSPDQSSAGMVRVPACLGG